MKTNREIQLDLFKNAPKKLTACERILENFRVQQRREREQQYNTFHRVRFLAVGGVQLY